ncbi:MAG: hypothetical protein ABI045_07370 [Flavobacteriales bacterium]
MHTIHTPPIHNVDIFHENSSDVKNYTTLRSFFIIIDHLLSYDRDAKEGI